MTIFDDYQNRSLGIQKHLQDALEDAQQHHVETTEIDICAHTFATVEFLALISEQLSKQIEMLVLMASRRA